MRLTIIGCSGSYPGPDSAASCYLVEADDEAGRTWRLVFDMGNGALGALQQHTDPLAVDGVLLSHLHADHCVDLTGYYVLGCYHPSGVRPTIPVWGPDGTAERINAAYNLPGSPAMTGVFDYRTLTGPIRVGPFEVVPTPVVHPVSAYAFRVSAGGRTLTYSGDSGVCANLDESARDADLFLVEASFLEGEDNPPDLHLTGREAAETATRAGARRVLVTHVPPWYDKARVLAEAKSGYDGPLDLAVAGATYEI